MQAFLTKSHPTKPKANGEFVKVPAVGFSCIDARAIKACKCDDVTSKPHVSKTREQQATASRGCGWRGASTSRSPRVSLCDRVLDVTGRDCKVDWCGRVCRHTFQVLDNNPLQRLVHIRLFLVRHQHDTATNTKQKAPLVRARGPSCEGVHRPAVGSHRTTDAAAAGAHFKPCIRTRARWKGMMQVVNTLSWH